MRRTDAQNRRLYALITQIGYTREERAALVNEHTRGRTCHTSELTAAECNGLIVKLETAVQSRHRENAERMQKMKRKVLSIAHQLGWQTPGGKVDWARLDAWLIKYGHKHCGLNEYRLNDLPTLITQLERMI